MSTMNTFTGEEMTEIAPQTLTIRGKTGEKEILAVPIDGTSFAYHPAYWLDGTSGPQYNITHIPTGLCFPFMFSGPYTCKLFVAALMQHEQQWERPDYTDEMKQICKQTYEEMAYVDDEEVEA